MGKRLLPRLLGPLLLLYFLQRVDWRELAAHLNDLAALDLILASLLMLPILPLRALRWSHLLPVDQRTPFLRLVDYYAFSAFLGALTPGQLGELTKIYHLIQRGTTRTQALFSTLADRVADLLWLLLCAWLFLLLSGHGGPFRQGLLWLPLPLGCLAWLLLSHNRQRHPHLLQTALSRLRSGRADISRTNLAVVSGTTVASWLLNWLAIYLAVRGLGLDIGLMYLGGLMALCGLSAILPISILGLGTRDAVLLYVMADHDPAAVLALSATVLLLRLVYAGFCAYAVWRPGVLATARTRRVPDR